MAIEYVFVDTCVLSDIIRQYNPLCPRNPLQEGNYLKKDMLRYVNQIITLKYFIKKIPIMILLVIITEMI